MLGRLTWLTFLLVVFTSVAVSQTPTVTGYRLVTGRADTLFPVATSANLDAGDLVTGSTFWDHGDGIFYVETRVGFLWSPGVGMRPFEIPENVYFDDNRMFPADISNSGAVVGTDLFTARFTAKPFVWSPTGGLKFLPVQGPRNTGSAAALSGNSRVVVGDVRAGFDFTDPTRASEWIALLSGNGGPGEIKPSSKPQYRQHQLPTPDLWSDAWDVSDDGNTIVGDSGPSDEARLAVRWVSGKLRSLGPAGGPSSARFTATDGSAAIGWADLPNHRVLVRWDAAGAAVVAEPPAGATIETINAVNPSATAAVGALSVAGNWAPYVWTVDDGFIVLPELGHETYFDFSEAYDLSDDARVVVGALQASVQGPGDPPPAGFVWVRDAGTFAVDDMLAASGFDRLGIYTVPSVSSRGTRILASGDPPRTDSDTNSVIMDIALP